MAASPRSGGRPRPPNEGERFPISFRVTPATKRRLDEAARVSGRSQSQEAELRLEQSFRDEQHLEQALELIYGQQLAGVLTVLSDVMKRVGERAFNASLDPASGETDISWLSDPYSYDQAMKGACVILEAMRPDGDPSMMRSGWRAPTAWHQYLGEDSAARTLLALTSRDPYEGLSDVEMAEVRPSEHTRKIRRFKALLGSIIARIRVPELRDLKAIDRAEFSGKAIIKREKSS